VTPGLKRIHEYGCGYLEDMTGLASDFRVG
jgi:hypothetical protein